MWRRSIPWLLILFRGLSGPALFILAWRLLHPQIILGALIALAFFSDVFDGILARRWGGETPALRVADSAVDTLFYLCILAAIIARHSSVLQERKWLLIGLVTLEAGRILFDWGKYRRMASYHSYASKLWGILLAISTIALLCFDQGSQLITIAIIWGIVCNLEGIAMSLLLPKWAYNVKSLQRALRLRREILAGRQAPEHIGDR